MIVFVYDCLLVDVMHSEPTQISDGNQQNRAPGGDTSQPIGSSTCSGSYHCIDCGAQFSTKSSLARHRNSNMKAEGVPYDCALCDFISVSKCKLDKHVTTHVNEYPPAYLCTYCDGDRNDLGKMLSHMQIDHKFGKEEIVELLKCGIARPVVNKTVGKN